MRLSMSSQDRRCSANDVGSATNPSKFSPSPLSDSVPSPSLRPSRPASMALSFISDVVVVDDNISSAPPSPSRRPGISPLQTRSPPPFLLIDERKNINRSLRICGFSSSRSTPTFPLSPTSSPSSPSSSNLKLPELEIPLLSPPHTPLALIDSPSTPCSLDVLSTCHFTPPPPSSSSSPSLRPRRQPLRSSMDSFTPAWIRGQGLEKEGYCSLCEAEGEKGEGDGNGRGGKWFRLKDGSYWYHRQFVHGISSISGLPFSNPIETRCATNEKGVSTLEGFCGTCSNWNTFETYRTPTTSTPSPSSPLVSSRAMWYRHAHACHEQVPIPKPSSTSTTTTTKTSGLLLQTSRQTTTPMIPPPFISLPIVAA
ncbi:hypothetical protein JCM16303_006778 [Sporobolomyces ruberrimus]